MTKSSSGLVFTVLVLLFNQSVGLSLQPPQAASSSSSQPATLAEGNEISRRSLFFHCGVTYASFQFASQASAADEVKGEGDSLLSTTDIALLLRPVPTFTIVDKKGVPFMVVGEDAKVTGYFFTTYKEASRILSAAKSYADKAIAKAKAEGESTEEIGTNPWKSARISSIPLDSAVTLVAKLSGRTRNYFKIAPADEDVDDALAITGEEDLAEGKVPIFYYADFTIDVDGSKKTPLYFRKSELEEAFKKADPGVAEAPQLLVTELFTLLAELVKPAGNGNDDLKSLVFIAPRESEKKKKECERGGGKEAPFIVGQRIIVL